MCTEGERDAALSNCWLFFCIPQGGMSSSASHSGHGANTTPAGQEKQTYTYETNSAIADEMRSQMTNAWWVTGTGTGNNAQLSPLASDTVTEEDMW